MSRLARSYPYTKFLRARAGAIGFASSGSSKPNLTLSRFPTRGLVNVGRTPIQEKDEFFDDEIEDEKGDDDDEDQDEEEQWEDDEVDTDVLPTLLVYRGGDLAHSWVRVDWEAKQGIEELLKRYAVYTTYWFAIFMFHRHNILTSPRHYGGTNSNGNRDLLDDDDFSDDGEELVFGNSDDER